MHMTATRNHSGQTNCLQPLECAGLYTEVTSLTVHTWPTFKCHRSLIIMIKKKNLGRLPPLAHCMCSSSISTNQSLQKTFPRGLLESKLDYSSGSSAHFVQLSSSCMRTEDTNEWEDASTYRIVQLCELSCFAH